MACMHPIRFILASLLMGGTVAAAADPQAGKTVVLQGNGQGATACVRCHGADGAGKAAAGFPRLAGLDAGYLRKQLLDFQTGTRKNPVMGPVAKALSAAEAGAVAAYYSAQTAPAEAVADADTGLIDRGARIALSGLWEKTIPACTSCHGPRGRGVGVHFPALAGQHADYIARQLAAWRDGSRSNDPQALMKGIAERLPEQDIAAVSVYFASLQPVR